MMPGVPPSNVVVPTTAMTILAVAADPAPAPAPAKPAIRVRCKKCDRPPLAGNYGFCAEHRTKAKKSLSVTPSVDDSGLAALSVPVMCSAVPTKPEQPPELPALEQIHPESYPQQPHPQPQLIQPASEPGVGYPTVD